METSPASPSPSTAQVLAVAPQSVVTWKQTHLKTRGQGERRVQPGAGGRSPRVLQLERGQHGATQPIAKGYRLLFFYLIRQ